MKVTPSKLLTDYTDRTDLKEHREKAENADIEHRAEKPGFLIRVIPSPRRGRRIPVDAVDEHASQGFFAALWVKMPNP
jgi:hypothetical protein